MNWQMCRICWNGLHIEYGVDSITFLMPRCKFSRFSNLLDICLYTDHWSTTNLELYVFLALWFVLQVHQVFVGCGNTFKRQISFRSVFFQKYHFLNKFNITFLIFFLCEMLGNEFGRFKYVKVTSFKIAIPEKTAFQSNIFQVRNEKTTYRLPYSYSQYRQWLCFGTS